MKPVGRKKSKRNISIFTIFIWIALIAVMSIIMISSIDNKNAIEQVGLVQVVLDVSDLDANGWNVEEYKQFRIVGRNYNEWPEALFEKYENGKAYYTFYYDKKIDSIDLDDGQFIKDLVNVTYVNGENVDKLYSIPVDDLVNEFRLVDNGESRLLEFNYDISELDDSYTKEEIEHMCKQFLESPGYKCIKEFNNNNVKVLMRDRANDLFIPIQHNYRSFIELYDESDNLCSEVDISNLEKQVYNFKIKDKGSIKKYIEIDISSLRNIRTEKEIENIVGDSSFLSYSAANSTKFCKEKTNEYNILKYSVRVVDVVLDNPTTCLRINWHIGKIFLKEESIFEEADGFYYQYDIRNQTNQDVYYCTLLCEEDVVYNVEQIKSMEEVKNDSAEEYIIVAETDEKTYALASSVKEDSNKFVMGIDNAEEVIINEDGTKITTTNLKENILWNFTMSKKSVADGKNGLVIASSKTLFSGSDETKTQIFFDTTNTANNPAGMSYSNDTYDYNLHFNSDGTVKIEQNNGKAKYSYLRFYTPDKRFLSGTPGKAANVKIYKVKRDIKVYEDYTSIESEPEYPNPGSVSINKTAKVDDDYENTGIATVELLANAIPIEQEKEVVLVMDYSNSVIYRTGEDITETKIEIFKRIALEFADKLLKQNPNNKISVVKFTGEIIDKEKTEEIGLTNDFEEVKEIINLPRKDSLGGTNYTIAFEESLKLLDNNESEKDKIVIFMSDGAPTIYNRLKFSVFNKTEDGIVGNYATNWVNYFLNNGLYTNEDMKKSGIKIYTAGVIIEDEFPIASNGSFVVKREELEKLLENLSTAGSYFYDELEETTMLKIYDDIYNDFYVPSKVEIRDEMSSECSLLESGNITLEKAGKIIEEIKFENGEVYSNLKGDTNIKNGNVIDGEYIKIEGKNIKVDVKDLKEDVRLTYKVYLDGSTNLKNEGKYRESGIYYTNKEAYLTYINHKQEEITKEYPKPQIAWEKKVNVKYIAEEGGMLEGKTEETINALEYPKQEIEILAEEGYRFVKWEVEENGERIKVNPVEYQVLEDTTFYAVFEKIPSEVDTSDMNVGIYVVISLMAIVGVVVGIFIIKRSKK